MGQHYIPQRYLRGFQCPERTGMVWAFDKQLQTAKQLPIKNVAQERGFYDQDVEDSLNRDVELPGYAVIEKVCRGETINEAERKYLTYYIGTMLRRVPHARARAESFVPQIIEQSTENAKALFIAAAAAGELDPETLAARLAEVEEAREKFLMEPPDEARKSCKTAWPFLSWLHAIHGMYWRVLRVSAGRSRFLTSDNPAHFFEAYGLGHDECEVIFPLRSDVLLHCSRQRCQQLSQVDCAEALVKEVNRRVAGGATRFVFYHAEASWVLNAAKNRPEQMKRIYWE